MDDRFKSIYGNQYAQVFTNNNYFDKVYPLYYKRMARKALKKFCQEFGVTEKLTFDGYKEHVYNGTTFIKEIHRQLIDYHISDHELHNQSLLEGVII